MNFKLFNNLIILLVGMCFIFNGLAYSQQESVNEGKTSKSKVEGNFQELENEIKHLIRTINKSEASRYGRYYPSVRKLARIGKPAVPYLIKALSNSDTAGNAIKALGQIGSDAEEAVPVLMELLRNRKHQWDVADAMRGIGPGAKKAVPLLIDLLKETMGKQGSIDQVAAGALGKIGDPQAFNILVKALAMEEDEYLAAAAAEALGKSIGLGDKKAIPYLIQAASSKYESVRYASISQLMFFEDEKTIPTFVTALGDQSSSIRTIAYMGLIILSKKMNKLEFGERLKKAVANSNDKSKQKVEEILVEIGIGGLARKLSKYEVVIEKRWEITDISTHNFPLDATWPLIVDQNGNVFIAGTYFTKYDKNGKRLFHKQIFNGAFSEKQPVASLAREIIMNGNNIYIMGWKHQRSRRPSLVLYNLDKKGNQRWKKEYSDIENPIAMNVDSLNSVIYIAGGVGICNDKIVMLQLDENGCIKRKNNIVRPKHIKKNEYSEKEIELEIEPVLKLDQNGNLYAITRYGMYVDVRIFLTKYNSQGDLIWNVPFLSEDIDDYNTHLNYDKHGNIYVLIKKDDDTIQIIKTKINGTINWSKEYNVTNFWPNVFTIKDSSLLIYGYGSTNILSIEVSSGSLLWRSKINQNILSAVQINNFDIIVSGFWEAWKKGENGPVWERQSGKIVKYSISRK